MKDVANENLSDMVLVLFVNLEIGTRFLLVVGIGLLLGISPSIKEAI